MALHLLTGFPDTDYLHGNLEQLQQSNDVDLDGLWRRLMFGEKRNYCMSAGTTGAGENEIEGSGIVSGHAYTLLGAFEVNNL
jgi:hypothetical protein